MWKTNHAIKCKQWQILNEPGTKLTPKLTLGVTSYCKSLEETILSWPLKKMTTTNSDFFTTDTFWRKTKFNILVQFFIFSFSCLSNFQFFKKSFEKLDFLVFLLFFSHRSKKSNSNRNERKYARPFSLTTLSPTGQFSGKWRFLWASWACSRWQHWPWRSFETD